MKKVISALLVILFRLAFSLRYRVRVKGLENLNETTLNKTGGVLFLPNHPTIFVDPVLVSLHLWKKFQPHPVVIEYMFYKPVVNWLMRFIGALPVPDVSTGGNSFKRYRIEKAITGVIKALQKKENVIIYPAGRSKLTAYESLGASSGVHRILEDVPEANVVLVRTTGLWGSSFSRALTGKTPSLFGAIWNGVKIVFKNLIFFAPRRNVEIELVPAPADFPYKAPRLEQNIWLEAWYNRPDGLAVNPPGYQGESLVLVPYTFWSNKLPKVQVTAQQEAAEAKALDLEHVPAPIQKQVLTQIGILAERSPDELSPGMDLARDLGLDSLDLAELISFLESQYDVKGISTEDLNTVGKVLAIASGQLQVHREVVEEKFDTSVWTSKRLSGRASIPEGHTIPEVFLRACDRFPDAVACADGSSGILTYKQLKMRVLLIADYLHKLPDDSIGIMLPASVAAEVMILACQLAGKVPVMINWTVGPRHFETVVKQTGIRTVLTSWKFIDRLENIELGLLDERICLLEDVRHHLSLACKIRAKIRSNHGADKLLDAFGIRKLSEHSPAVILFTSGSEGMPKGVPLSHANILSNQRATIDNAKLEMNEVLYSMLPPFHSFGFTVTGLIPLLSGIRVVYSPDPNDSPYLANGIQKWGVTLLCGAPTFLKGILKAAEPAQLASLRTIISGAEKPPAELFELIKKIGHPVEYWEGYGITECSPVLTMTTRGEVHKGVGKPLPGVELTVVNPDTLETLLKGQQGLILARGPNIFSGYLKDPSLSPFVRVGGKQWYQTGDLGYLDDEGNLIISDRLKRFIKLGGEMISLTAVEEAITQEARKRKWPLPEEGHPLAICPEDRTGEKPKMVLFATWDTDVPTINAALKESGFSNLIKISSVVRVEEIPLMGTGKVSYRQLEEKYIKKPTTVTQPFSSV